MKHRSLLLRASLYVAFVLTSLCTVASFVAAQICVPPPEGLVSWWPGDGNTDDIVSGRNAVLRDNATIGSGFVGEGFLLDGDGDFVEVPHDPALNVGAGDFTVDFWVLFNSTAGESVLVEKYVQGTGVFGWSLSKVEDSLFLTLGNQAGDFAIIDSGPLSIPTGTWIHFAVKRSGDTFTTFMNGTPVATGLFSTNLDNTSSLKFGHRGSPDDTPGSIDTRGFFLNGRIDEVEFFIGRALSDTEIQAIFNAGSAGKCKGVPLTPLAAQATLSLGSQAADDTFDLQAAFILGDGSNGVDPLSEAVTVQIGTAALTIPAGAFHRSSAGAFVFAGVQEGVTLQVTITPLTRASFEVIARGEGATLSGLAVPVPVSLAIGDDHGKTTLPTAEVRARTPPLQR